MSDTLKRLSGPPVKVDPIVPESGRVWSVDYDNIPLIPEKELEHGDVLVVTRKGYKGYMLMQAIQKPGGRFKLEDMARDVN